MPGCKSTCKELLPGRITRCVSPATTSTSSGGRTVRVVTTGGGKAGAAVFAVSVFIGVRRALWWSFAVGASCAAAAGSRAGAVLATGELSIGRSDSASGESGNQKSRSCHSTMLKASRSKHSEPTINSRCL